MDDIENLPLDQLSQATEEWDSVAAAQLVKDRLADQIFRLPLEEFRALKYVPPPLPRDIPNIGIDITVSEVKTLVRDGSSVAMRVYKPIDPPADALLFFNAHGGGWVLGSPETEEAQNRLIAFQNRVVVVSVDYRRAPEFPFPYPINDCYDCLQWCKRNAGFLGINPHRIILGGGIAGANIVAVLAQQSPGDQSIIGQILNIPVTCHPDHFPYNAYQYTSYTQNHNAPIVGAERMRWFWDQYVNADAARSPEASPLLAPTLIGLPPALIQVAGMDPLRDEGIAYARRLIDSGVKVEFKMYPGVPHAFYSYPELPQTAQYFQAMLDWIESIS